MTKETISWYLFSGWVVFVGEDAELPHFLRHIWDTPIFYSLFGEFIVNRWKDHILYNGYPVAWKRFKSYLLIRQSWPTGYGEGRRFDSGSAIFRLWSEIENNFHSSECSDLRRKELSDGRFRACFEFQAYLPTLTPYTDDRASWPQLSVQQAVTDVTIVFYKIGPMRND